MTAERFYSPRAVDGPWDIVIVGSGASALTAGAMLSEAGKRVLLLEQHFRPGGFTHTFTRQGYEWDVGLHYVGKAPVTSTWYLQLAGLTDGAFQLAPFDDYLDELYFPDFHVLLPNSYEGYIQALQDRFPHEASGIRSYVETIQYLRRKLQLYFGVNLLPRPLTRFARATLARRPHRLALSTTDEVMGQHIRDEKLKAVIDAQWGNIGAPRQRCSFLIHAGMLGNYLEAGAAYPVGGSGVFARELGRIIYRNDGAVRTKARVAGLRITDNTVRGVTLEGGEEIDAPLVISSNGLFNTYLKLLKGEASCAPAIEEIERFKPAYEYINLFIGFHRSPAELGLGRGNTWIHPDWNTASDDPTWDVSDLEASPLPKVLFFSSSSLRDPGIAGREHNGFNGQIVSAVRYGSFDRWKGSAWKHRADDYHALKDAISERLMAVLDDKYPGIRDNVAYMELGTTLTYDHFTASHGGIPYGLASTPARFRSLITRPTTPVKNLYVCGQDLIMPGIPAAVGSANLCCSLILRRNAASRWTKKGRAL